MAVSNLLLGLFFLVVIATARSQCQSRNQSETLRALRDGLHIAAWNDSLEWSQWPGIVLDAQGQVSKISIAGINLTGALPPVWDELPSLVGLDVSQNRILSVNASRCKNNVLQSLNLSSNRLAEMANLSSLERLEILDLDGNFLTTVPRLSLRFPALRVLNLSFNNLTGDMVSIGDAIGENLGLEVLELSHNNFVADIPEFLGRMTKLTRLDISSNNLIGKIPEFFGNCTKLQYLGLSSNKLQGGLPKRLRKLQNLAVLSAGQNSLSGELELEVGDFAMMDFLSLPNNNFSGRLPVALGNLTNLRLLVLTGNKISGGIPPELGNCSQLQEIWLNNNFLTESLPAELSKLSNLRQLVLGQNSIHGPIPDGLSRCSKLRVLWMEQNDFSGKLPESLGSLSNLIILSLSYNRLDGTLPESYANLSSLIGLDVGGNNLSGEVPSLSKLTNLQFLFLSNNKFNGSIPDWLPNLPEFRAIDFSHNSFTGFIPSSIGQLFDKVELYNVSWSTPLVHSQTRVYTGFATPITIDFSYNFLQGTIPEEIGNISKLQVLDLSYNKLTGSIPESLGNDRNLMGVLLSSNQLNGSIPSSVANLSFLSVFNVSNNNLEGAIPNSQLSTLEPASFAGNRLCGRPLDKCPGNRSSGASNPDIMSGGGRTKYFPRVALFITIVAAIIICAIVTTYCTLARRRHKLHSNTERENPSFSLAFCEKLPEQICPEKLAAATDNYSHDHIVGDGGFGVVYRAVLENGQVVAVKKLSSTGLQGEREFRAELQTLSEIKHKNLVPLLGYCSDRNDRLLIYKYLKNGSVDTWLHCREPWMTPLDWPIRVRIARGAAQGIAYLHQGGEQRHSIVHRDIKVSNILLDEDFEAHVADFGLARLVNAGDTHVSTDVAGTIGYIPPEYSHKSQANPRGDVYSFGVVCLEILTAKRPTDQFFRKTTLVSWIQGMRSAEERKMALDGCLLEQSQGAGAAEFDQMLEMMRVACWCCRDAPSKRPSMQEVASLLERLEKRMAEVSSFGSSPCRERSSSNSSSNSSSSNSSSKNVSGHPQVVELSTKV